MNIQYIQTRLRDAGFYHGLIDGIWGSLSDAALDEALSRGQRKSLAWGASVDDQFRDKVFALCARQKLNPDFLMACMAWESAETFSPAIKNQAGSGATGLIQFMPTTAIGLGTNVNALSEMSAVRQLDCVEAYFKPYRGRLVTLSDHYMAILWPAAIGKPESSALWDRARRPTTYRQNAGLDLNRDGLITKAEAASKVQQKLVKGLTAEHAWRSV